VRRSVCGFAPTIGSWPSSASFAFARSTAAARKSQRMFEEFDRDRIVWCRDAETKGIG
jgi:hypothetical protein